MNILAIETSCDETAIAILSCEGDAESATYTILGNALISQIDVHQEFGGVFPAVAKREHAKNLVPILLGTLSEADMLKESEQRVSQTVHEEVTRILSREFELSKELFSKISVLAIPNIDVIAVTAGPGLAPALWVGVSFAKALSILWNKPIVGVNHMEGHLLTALAKKGGRSIKTYTVSNVSMPVLALLISGGHTELQLMSTWLSYNLEGQTRDDAVGEAYDKVARMLGLPYPGGPEISRLAERARDRGGNSPYTFPRPMISDAHSDFSFSGLKTSVLYSIRGKVLSDTDKENISLAFEDAVAEVLYVKTKRALLKTGAKTIAIGGGVSANKNIRDYFGNRLSREHPEVSLTTPTPELSGDNAIMIGIAGYYRARNAEFADTETLQANGNLAL